MQLNSLKEFEVRDKSVLLRTDFNVPMQDAAISDVSRLENALPTIEYLVKRQARIIIVSHFGRPAGWEEKFSFRPVAERLAEILNRKFATIAEALPDYDVPHVYFFGQNIERVNILPLLRAMRGGDIAFLENLRFYPGEKNNDPLFAQKLASLAGVYVNEAFSASHRAHASMVGVPALLPSAAGLSLEKEILNLSRVLDHPKKPVVVMMGGIKLADKAGAIENLARVSEAILLGGGLANLFLKMRGFEIGKSVWGGEEEIKLARQLWRDYQKKIKLPLDAIVSTRRDGAPEYVRIDKVKAHHLILDIGPETIRHYSKFLKLGQTLVWGGPMGYYENKSFSHGTFALGRLFASRSKSQAFGVAGGGETLDVIARLGMGKYIDHVSTGGGAMLEFLAGKSLPALEALKK
ncbi:MAG: phosphoglycerate kinase [Candidatus Doudnabacteria bacterium]|nr:phosphoglycerate kinase [Candidatus Doudnabacteria bacterium]